MTTARPHLLALGAIVVLVALAVLGVRDAFTLDLVFTLLLYAVLGQSVDSVLAEFGDKRLRFLTAGTFGWLWPR